MLNQVRKLHDNFVSQVPGPADLDLVKIGRIYQIYTRSFDRSKNINLENLR